MRQLQERGKKAAKWMLTADTTDVGSSPGDVISEEQSNCEEDVFAAEDDEYEGSEMDDDDPDYEAPKEKSKGRLGVPIKKQDTIEL